MEARRRRNAARRPEERQPGERTARGPVRPRASAAGRKTGFGTGTPACGGEHAPEGPPGDEGAGIGIACREIAAAPFSKCRSRAPRNRGTRDRPRKEEVMRIERRITTYP